MGRPQGLWMEMYQRLLKVRTSKEACILQMGRRRGYEIAETCEIVRSTIHSEGLGIFHLDVSLPITARFRAVELQFLLMLLLLHPADFLD